MDDEESKQTSRRLRLPPFTQLNQVSSDSAVAMALQEQATVLATIKSDEEDDESDEVSDETLDNNDYEYFENFDFESELEFLEGHGDSNIPDDYDEMDEDGIDVDELSYEELLALGEFIGEEKRGLSSNEIPRCLRPWKPSSLGSKPGIDRCVVCQVEYEEGESVVALPCEHPYHSECISKWLQVKKICPICSNEVSPTKTP